MSADRQRTPDRVAPVAASAAASAAAAAASLGPCRVAASPLARAALGRVSAARTAAVLAILLLAFAAGAVAGADPSPIPTVGPTAPAGTTPPPAGTTPAPDDPLPSPLPAPSIPAPLVHPQDGVGSSCVECHSKVNPREAEITETWAASIHGKGGIGCTACHGGDPTTDSMRLSMSRDAGFIGIPSRERIVGVCGSCHSDVERMRVYRLPTDQYAKYFSSVHGQRLVLANDTRVAICVDCHGSHDVKKASDPTAAVYPPNVPRLCASCHADPDLMEPYDIPVDQFRIYEQSVHGRALLGRLDVRAPSCASCHGSHDAKPPRSTEVVEVCGKCHTATQDLYLQSQHAQVGGAAPKCWTCHGTHDVAEPGAFLFLHEAETTYTCSTCHDPADPARLRIELERFSNADQRRCDTCHHPGSVVYAQVKGIHAALDDAQRAFDAAEARIAEAARLGMITDDAEVELSQAKTSLIQAQAAVHTTSITAIAVHTDEAVARAGAAEAIAQASLDESGFRRQAMVVVLALILANVLILFAWKRRLDRELEEPAAPHG